MLVFKIRVSKYRICILFIDRYRRAKIHIIYEKQKYKRLIKIKVKRKRLRFTLVDFYFD